MKYPILFLLFFVLNACADKNAPRDTETNKYYADYIEIYNAYDSLGNSGTLQALNTYLEQFPERKEAYLFKAYILGDMGDIAAADDFFEKARKKDSLNVQVYELHSAFLLYDTTKTAKIQQIIQLGLEIDDSSSILYNNLAWLNIMNQDFESAVNHVAKGYALDKSNLNIYRTGFIAAYLQKDQEALSFYIDLIGNNSTNQHLTTIIEEQGAYALYKSLE